MDANTSRIQVTDSSLERAPSTKVDALFRDLNIKEYYYQTLVRVVWDALMVLISPTAPERSALTAKVLQTAHLDVIGMTIKVLREHNVREDTLSEVLDQIAEHSTEISKEVKQELQTPTFDSLTQSMLREKARKTILGDRDGQTPQK